MRLNGCIGSERMGARSDQYSSGWIVDRLIHVLALQKRYFLASPACWDNASSSSVSEP